MKKVLIWGTGDYYQANKSIFYSDIEIVGFIENDFALQGTIVDSKQVYNPDAVFSMEYDFIFILCPEYQEIRRQLMKLDLPRNIVVYDVTQIEMLCPLRELFYYNYPREATEKTKLLIFSPALISTGAQNVLMSLIMILNKRKFDITVVSKSDGVLKTKLLDMGISVVVTPDFRADSDHIRSLVAWSDVILVNTLWLSYLVEGVKKYDRHVIWWLHESAMLAYLDINSIYRCLCDEKVITYAVSKVVSDYLEEKTGQFGRIRLLPFGIPSYAKESSKTENRKLVFALIAGVSYIKGQDIYLNAINALSKKYKDKATFLLIGAGSLDNTLQGIVDCNDCIQVLGEIDNRLMPKTYSEIDIVCCCSREESMSVTVIEGFMNGKLAIISDKAGVASYVSDGENAFVVNVEDVEAWKNSFEWVIDHPRLANNIGNASRKLYDAYFTMEAFESRVKIIFNELGFVW